MAIAMVSTDAGHKDTGKGYIGLFVGKPGETSRAYIEHIDRSKPIAALINAIKAEDPYLKGMNTTAVILRKSDGTLLESKSTVAQAGLVDGEEISVEYKRECCYMPFGFCN
jgi:hypothetical protein